MHWRWEYDREMVLVDATDEERRTARQGIANLPGRRQARCDHGQPGCLQLSRPVACRGRSLKSLSSWCHTEGKYQEGWEPAKKVSRAFFNGQVLPRLTPFRGDGVTGDIARQRFAEFAEKAGFLTCRPPPLGRDRKQNIRTNRRSRRTILRPDRDAQLPTSADLSRTILRWSAPTAITIWRHRIVLQFHFWPTGQRWSSGCPPSWRLSSVKNHRTTRRRPLSIRCPCRPVLVTVLKPI